MKKKRDALHLVGGCNAICRFHLTQQNAPEKEQKRIREQKNNVDDLLDMATTAMDVEKYIFFYLAVMVAIVNGICSSHRDILYDARTH